MTGSLATTNVLIGVMMAMSVIQTGMLLGAGIGMFLLYRRVASLINAVDTRDVNRAIARTNEILDDVKELSSRVTHDVERVEDAVQSTIDRAHAIRTGV